MIIYKTLLRRRYILKKSVFGMLYGQRASLVHISTKNEDHDNDADIGERYRDIFNAFFVPKLDDVEDSTILVCAISRIVGLWRGLKDRAIYHC